MLSRYFKRAWNGSTGDKLTGSWGHSTYYFESDPNGNVLRQIESYANGNKLKYDQDHFQDEYGRLSDQPLDLEEFNDFKIEKDEFEKAWS